MFFLRLYSAIFLQHFWHFNLVPTPLHEAAHQVGQRAGELHRQVPLVCRPLPRHLLPAVAVAERVRPVHGRLAGLSGRGRAATVVACHDRHHQCDAAPLAKQPARGAALLGLPAMAPAASTVAAVSSAGVAEVMRLRQRTFKLFVCRVKPSTLAFGVLHLHRKLFLKGVYS